MSTQQRLLIGFYALVALAALYATWSQNLQLMAPGMGPFDPYTVFVEQTRVNPASRSITVDIGFFLLAAAAFMVIEARRLGVRFVWLYVILAFVIAISVTFPLFMIARERIAKTPDAAAAWRLTVGDVIGLAVVAAVVLALAWRVIS
jgi:ABC-type amino acid transport system permease subunit